MQRYCCCEGFRLWCSPIVVFQGAGNLANSATEREKEVSQSFHISNLCFCIVQEKAHFKKASQWTKIFLLKNK